MQTLDLTPALPFLVIGAAISYATMVLPGDAVAKTVKARYWSKGSRRRW